MFQAKKPAARMGPPQVPPPPMPPMAHAPFTPVESTEAARATIAHLFGEKYYEILASNPLDSHCFYYDESVLSRSEPHDLSSTPAVLGTAAINHKIMTSGLAHARTDVLSLDHQDTPAGILVMVAGSIVLKGEAASRRFVQTFLLVHRSNSYYIRNDIHRLLDRAPAAAPPPYRAHGAPLQPGLPPLDPVMMAVGAAGSQPRPAPPVPATTHPVQPPPAALVAPRPAPPPAPVAPAEPAAGPAEPHARPAARATRGSGGGGSGAGGGGAGGGGGSGGPKSWASVVGHEPLGDADGEPAHTPPAGGPAAFAEGRHAAAEGAHAGGDAGSARMAPVSAVRADAAGGVDGAVPKVREPSIASARRPRALRARARARSARRALHACVLCIQRVQARLCA